MQRNISSPPGPEVRSASQGDCASPVIFVFLMAWIAVLSTIQVGAVFLLSSQPGAATDRLAIPIALGQAILIGIPVVPLARVWREPRYRAIYGAWGMALVFLVLMQFVQFAGPSAAQTRALLRIGLSLVFILILLFRTRQRRRSSASEGAPGAAAVYPAPAVRQASIPLLGALLMGVLLFYPWLAWGALGSPLDTLLELAAALAVGAATGLLLDQYLFGPLLTLVSSDWRNFLLAGFGASLALVIVASGSGFIFGGMELLLLLVLPPLGWILLALYKAEPPGRSWLPLAILISLALAAPFMLIDADELALVITATAGEILQWAASAAGVSALAGLLFSLIGFVIYRNRRPQVDAAGGQELTWGRTALALALGLSVVAGALVYVFVGRPGFFGERLFVILKSQADVSQASQMSDPTARRAYVYQTLVQNANTSQAGLRQALDRLHIGYTPYYLENSLEVDADSFLVPWLNSRPEVDRVLPSPQMRPLPQKPPVSTGSASPPSSPLWNLTLIGADKVWNELGITGKGVVVGQSDSGVDVSHPELSDSYRGQNGDNNYNWFDPWYHTRSPYDLGGHGTHTMGIVLGNHTGVAPDASFFACVNLARNEGDPPLYLDCMQFMLAPFPLDGDPLADGDPARGAMVLNNSWGCPPLEGCDPDTLQQATQALRAAGIFVEASAGNDGPACATVTDPLALYSSAFTTGAIDRLGQLVSFSSRGPVTVDGSNRVKPDIVAPGYNVLSSFPKGTYQVESGTSMAGPHTVGVVALMWSANPALIGNIDRTEQILEQSAKHYTGNLPSCPGADQTPSTAVGYGVLDAYTAVKMALQEGH